MHDAPAPPTLGKYELVRKLGEGGMAEVHLARMTGGLGTEKFLVLKRLTPELAKTERFMKMFLSEARLAVGLHHANIVQVYDADQADGIPFYVMEYLHGRDVRELMSVVARRGERVPMDQAIAIALSTCAALRYAHDLIGGDGRPLAIVHRDVSPHNVFVLYDGVVKVIDFGIAKLATHDDRTATGMLTGKFGYMSPEQCLQQPLDARSDQFCIGILLWELTTGARLFKAPSDYQMVKAIVEANATPPSSIEPSYPQALEAIVMKALKRDRRARYATLGELEHDLEAFARAHRLDVSAAPLGRYMQRLFGNPRLPWPGAPASQSPVQPSPVQLEPIEPSDATATAAVGGDVTRSTAVTETDAPASPAAGWGRWRSAGLAALVLAVAVVGVALLFTGDDRARLDAALETPPGPAAAPAPSSSVSPSSDEAPPRTSAGPAPSLSSAATPKSPPARRPAAPSKKPPAAERTPDSGQRAPAMRPRWGTRVGRWAVLALFVLVTSGAAAQEASMGPAARAHLERGLRYFETQDYAAAIVEFKAGYQVEPNRDFLYALAQAQRLSGDCRSAIVAYRSFLRADPPEKEAALARDNMERCEATLPKEEPRPARKPANKPAPKPAPGTEPAPFYTDWIGDTLCSLGIVGLVLGGTFLALAFDHASSAGEAPTFDEYEGEVERAEELRVAAGATGAAGAILIGVGIVRFATLPDSAAVARSPGLSIILGGAF